MRGYIMKTLLFVSFLSASLAQDKPADPITDRLRLEIVSAQRDYLIAQDQMSRAENKFRSKMSEAGKTCEEAGRQFELSSLTCVDKPK